MSAATAQTPVGVQPRTLAVVAAGTALALVTYTTPIATLASTATALGAGAGGQAWILSSMSLGLAVALLPTGTVGDEYGRRRVFGAGALALTGTSIVAALSPNTLTLVLARIGQGLASAAILSCGLGLIGHTFPSGPARTRATGIWGACLGLGIALGPMESGALDSALGWRSAYVLIAVLASVLAALSRGLLVESTSPRHHRVDRHGMLLLGAALAAVLAGLVEGRNGWGRPSVAALLAGGALLAAAFVVVELRSAAPMLDLHWFGRPDFAGATIGALATGVGLIAIMSFLPTLLQHGLHHTASYAALLLFAWSGTSVVTALLARRLPATVPASRQLVLGLLVVGLGLAMLGDLGRPVSAARLLPGLVVAGAASGLVNAALARLAVTSAPAGLASVGSAVNNTARYLAGAIGVTVVSVLAAKPAPAAMVDGWNLSIALAAAACGVGAVAVAACRPRSPGSAYIGGGVSPYLATTSAIHGGEPNSRP